MFAFADVFWTTGSLSGEASFTGASSVFGNAALLAAGIEKQVMVEGSYLAGGSSLVRTGFMGKFGGSSVGAGLRFWSPGRITTYDEFAEESGSVLPWRVLVSFAYSPAISFLGSFYGGAGVDMYICQDESMSFGGAFKAGLASTGLSFLRLFSAYVSIGYDPWLGFSPQITVLGDYAVYSAGTSSVDAGAVVSYRYGPMLSLFVSYGDSLKAFKGLDIGFSLKVYYEPSFSTIYVSPLSGTGLFLDVAMKSIDLWFNIKMQSQFVFYTAGFSYAL